MCESLVLLNGFFRINFQNPTSRSVSTNNFIVLDNGLSKDIVPIHDATNSDVLSNHHYLSIVTDLFSK